MNSFLSDLNPVVIDDITQWQDHPELGKLHAKLVSAVDHETSTTTIIRSELIVSSSVDRNDATRW